MAKVQASGGTLGASTMTECVHSNPLPRKLKIDFIASPATIITTICSQTDVEFSPRRKPSRKFTKTFSKNNAPYKPAMTMPSLRGRMRLLGCGRHSGR